MARAKKAAGKVEVTRLENLPTDLSKHLSHYHTRRDDHIDPTCEEYRGFKVGQVVYNESDLLFNQYTEEKILGFTEQKGVGMWAKDEPEGFRRIITAMTYKGRVEIYSHPPRGYFAELPKYKAPPTCAYCKRRKVGSKNMGGACDNPRCVLAAMRDSL